MRCNFKPVHANFTLVYGEMTVVHKIHYNAINTIQCVVYTVSSCSSGTSGLITRSTTDSLVDIGHLVVFTENVQHFYHLVTCYLVQVEPFQHLDNSFSEMITD